MDKKSEEMPSDTQMSTHSVLLGVKLRGIDRNPTQLLQSLKDESESSGNSVDYVKNFSSQQTPKLDACFEMLSVSHVFYWINWKMCLKLLDLVGKKPHSLLLNSTDSLFFF